MQFAWYDRAVTMISALTFLVGLLAIVSTSCCDGQRLKTEKSVLNRCMDGKHHKDRPVSTKLYGVCKPWESKTCCSNTTAYHSQASLSKLYNLNLNHCGNMSEKCQKRFFRSNCFYECSPNVGPWLKRDISSIRNERFLHVPLCARDCTDWFNDCKEDFTCVQNWGKDFAWINGTNHCPTNKTCRTFKDIFKNSTNFCETVYTDDFKVEQNDSQCMKLLFTGPENPNAKVARDYAKRMNMYITTPTGSRESTTTVAELIRTIPKKDVVTRVVLPIVLLVFVVLLGICIYKGRDYVETSKRAGTKFCPCFNKASATRHSVLHHQTSQEDQQFLQEDREESDDTPHGALEIDL